MNQIATTNGALDPKIIESLVIGGDLGGLDNKQRVAYYNYRCKQAGLDPSAKPFDVLKLSGKTVLYANAGCTQQLCQIHGLSPTITDRTAIDGIYCVTMRVTGKDGRVTENMGAVPIKGLAGDALANAMMKAVTKAKRRTVLDHCGLGMLDETEVETIPGAQMQGRGNPLRHEYAQFADEIQACGDRESLDAFWGTPDIVDFRVRAAKAANEKGGVDYEGALQEQYNRRWAEMPERKEDKRNLIKTLEEYPKATEVYIAPVVATQMTELAQTLKQDAAQSSVVVAPAASTVLIQPQEPSQPPDIPAALDRRAEAEPYEGETITEADKLEMDFMASVDSCDSVEELKRVRRDIEAVKEKLGDNRYATLKRACVGRSKEIAKEGALNAG